MQGFTINVKTSAGQVQVLVRQMNALWYLKINILQVNLFIDLDKQLDLFSLTCPYQKSIMAALNMELAPFTQKLCIIATVAVRQFSAIVFFTQDQAAPV